MTETPGEVEPIPPRYWWLKRILVTFGVFIVILAGVRWWWGWEADRRLQARIDGYLAAGEPIHPKDFDSKPVPDEQNAAWTLEQATIALDMTTEQIQAGDAVREGAEATPADYQELQEAVEGNAEFFDWMRKARDAPEADWGIRIRSPAISFVLPGLSTHRQAAKFLAAAAALHHQNGDDEPAIEMLRDAFAHAEVMERHPMLISHLAAIACDGVQFRVAERVTATLSVAVGTRAADDTLRPAKRDQVQALISTLLDESTYQEGLVRAVQADRMMQLDIADLVLSGNASIMALTSGGGIGVPSFNERVLVFLLGPLLKLDTTSVLDYMTAFVKAAEKTGYAEAKAAFPPEPVIESLYDELTHPLSLSWGITWMDRVVLLSFRHRAERRMAAVGLAIRLYELDHGRRPEVLGELVPQYLAAVPLDPFAPDETVVSYLPDADQPMLYCIGPDGVDDGGAYTFYRSGGIHGDKLDMPYFLDGKRPKRQTDDGSTGSPSPDTAADQNDEQGGEGQPQENHVEEQ